MDQINPTSGNRISFLKACPFCGNQIAEGRVPEVCNLCKRKLAILLEKPGNPECPSCQGILVWGAKFCHHCGSFVSDNVDTQAVDPAQVNFVPPSVQVSPMNAQPGQPPPQQGVQPQQYPQQQVFATPPPPTNNLPPDVQREISSIASLEQIGAIVWLIIGILQVLSFWMALVGIWNIYVATTRFRRKKDIENLHPGVPKSVEGEMGWYIFFIVLNLFAGVLVGVTGAVIDIFIRERILKVRWAFEQQQAAQVIHN